MTDRDYLFDVKKYDFNGTQLYIDAGDTLEFESVGYYLMKGTEKECCMAPVQFVKDKSVCVVAGGCIGYFPLLLADVFDQVYTFEPDPLNFYCLVNNIPNENVIKSQFGLGYKKENLSMIVDHSFSGMNHINPEKSKGNIRIIQLDDLDLETCGMITFDMEGYEFEALKGSQRTISRCRPVLSIAFEGHTERYGLSGQDELDYIVKFMNYTPVARSHLDIIFIPTEWTQR